MESQFHDLPDSDLMSAMPPKTKITLPLVALALDFAPILFFFLAWLHEIFIHFALLGIIASPIIGVITGITALGLGKKHVGKVGVILAAIAAAFPIVFVLTMVLLLKTGAIVLGM